ncbi:hypothetical protein [Sulfurimonas sp.]|uniref:hypothetical protein n=1 Tax=Sulfurimonas sp. TaxID=2022749 RepID=UPI001A050E05|nr:hypothetical protein [Sulfurimonas sp.]MBE0515588.1 hypothetical protein [Sulfurimonas sp.]
METEILSIVKELLAISIGFVGLVLTAYSILMTLSDENWKIKKLKQSERYKKFISDVANLAIGFMSLFIFSIAILVIEKLVATDYRIFFNSLLYFYLAILFYLSIMVVSVLNKFKKIILLLANNEKPFLEMTTDSNNHED